MRRATESGKDADNGSDNFYPRSPCGERHKRPGLFFQQILISIHALLAESDRCQASDISAKRISIHALLAESDFRFSIFDFLYLPFLSTLSLRRATLSGSTKPRARRISIHALLAESDNRNARRRHGQGHISIHALLAESDGAPPASRGKSSKFLSTLSLRRATDEADGTLAALEFLSTLSLRRATCAWCKERTSCQFLSTLSLRRATDGTVWRRWKHKDISIHALLAESDCRLWLAHHGPGYFYPRSPCGERLQNIFSVNLDSVFLSTLSLRRATTLRNHLSSLIKNFYPRSPCGERRQRGGRRRPGQLISIHALLAESDGRAGDPGRQPQHFYPRSPCGERPALEKISNSLTPISIHALLAESDCQTAWPGCLPGYFYPRSPCGERPSPGHDPRLGLYFYPRSPCGERPPWTHRPSWCSNFYPRSPCGERRIDWYATGGIMKFLSTLSLRRATRVVWDATRLHKNFYPRSPCGERPQWFRRSFLNIEDFYPRSPCGERRCAATTIRRACNISIHALLAESDDCVGQVWASLSAISIHALLAESDATPA